MGVIRVALALSVVIAHVGPIFGFTLLGGPIAVESFYIISGFYMSLILNEKYIGRNGSYKLFLTNRLLRLYPIYWVVLLISIFVSLAFALHSHGTYWSKLQPYSDYGHLMSFGTIIVLSFTNLFLIGQDMILFLGMNSGGHLFFTSNFWNTSPHLYTFLLVPQAWTIGLEITFYLIAPFLVKRKLGVITIIIALSLIIRLILIGYGLGNDPWNYRFFPNEILFFLLGNVAYKIFKKIENIDINRAYLIVTMIGILIFSLVFNKIDFPLKTQIYFFIFFLSIPFIFKLTKNSRMDSVIGDLSYPIYLSHTLIMTVLKGRMHHIVAILGEGIIVIICTILFSILLNNFIAKPIEGYRQRRLAKLVLK